jgi:hypothetical protein
MYLKARSTVQVLLLSLIVLTHPFPANAQTKDGFMGYSWGTPFSEMKEKFNLTQTSKQGEQFQFSTNIESIDGVTLYDCEFEFVGDAFAGVIITTRARTNSRRLLTFLQKTYGEGHAQDLQTIQWMTNKTHVSYDEGKTGNAYVYLYSMKHAEEFESSQRGNH